MTIAIFAGFFLIAGGYSPIGKGLILGAVFGVINFVLMGEMLPLRLGKSKPRATCWALGSIGVRYALLAVPLIMAIKLEQFNLFAVTFGIFLVQIVILSEHVVGFIVLSRKKPTIG